MHVAEDGEELAVAPDVVVARRMGHEIGVEHAELLGGGAAQHVEPVGDRRTDAAVEPTELAQLGVTVAQRPGFVGPARDLGRRQERADLDRVVAADRCVAELERER